MAEDRINAALNQAQTSLQAFAAGPAQDAADSIGAAFEKAGAKIATALTHAAGEGEVSFKRLAKTILEEFAKIALDRLLGGVGAPSASPTSFGANLFNAAPIGAGPMSVNFHFAAGADADSIRRNQAQIAAQVARAASYGRRNL